MTTACEYLADLGLIGKVSLPARLTKKSNVMVQELAFVHLEHSPASPDDARMDAAMKPRASVRTTIAVQGARVHNLKNISVEIPRDSLVVVTGLSGSGKSSLAFDTIYAEGQRRYMESLSTFAKRFIAQVTKPDVDFVFGLSPVISIEQKTLANNPRSTVGTMTDIASYLNLLFATIAQAHCPRTGEAAPSRSASQILEAILSLPEGAEVELRAPVFKVYGEDLDFVFTEVRKKGCRRLIVDGKTVDLSEKTTLDDSDVQPHGSGRRPLRRRPQAREGHQGRHCRNAARRRRASAGAGRQGSAARQKRTASTRHCAARRITSSTATSVRTIFVFNNPESACRTCGGLGVDKLTHPELLIPDPKRSILGGCFVREAFKYNPDTWDGRLMFSLSSRPGVRARHAVATAARKGPPRHPLRHRAAEDPRDRRRPTRR